MRNHNNIPALLLEDPLRLCGASACLSLRINTPLPRFTESQQSSRQWLLEDPLHLCCLGLLRPFMHTPLLRFTGSPQYYSLPVPLEGPLDLCVAWGSFGPLCTYPYFDSRTPHSILACRCSLRTLSTTLPAQPAILEAVSTER